MEEQNILKEIPVCPWCGSSETIGQRVAREMHRKEAFTSLRKEIIPLDSAHLAVLYTRQLVLYHDICFYCGRSRLTRAEIIKVPVKGAIGKDN